MKALRWNTLYLLPALALAGCITDTAGGGATLGPYTGNGTLGDPYLLPSEMPAGTDGGIEDYFAEGGAWLLDIGAVNRNYDTEIEELFQLVYVTEVGAWELWFTSTHYGTYPGTADYDSATGTYSWCGTSGCAEDFLEFGLYDAAPATSQYGTFGFARHYSSSYHIDMHAYFHTGLATADMPTAGTAAYAGAFEALYVDTATGDSMRSTGGAILASADFGLGTVDMATTTAGTFGNGDTYEFAVTGAAVAGNAFAGGVYAGSYTDVSAATAHAFDGAMSGGFYGPAAAEMAGTFEGTSATLPDADITGGFWAKQ